MMMYQDCDEITKVVDMITTMQAPTVYLDKNGCEHCIWEIADPCLVESLVTSFSTVKNLYVADGHHRMEAACQRSLNEKIDVPILSVLFPQSQMRIHSYHRIVQNITQRLQQQHQSTNLLDVLSPYFEVKEISPPSSCSSSSFSCLPPSDSSSSLYLSGAEDSNTENDYSHDDYDPSPLLLFMHNDSLLWSSSSSSC